MKFVLNKAKWLRGDASISQLHRHSDGKMCCVGQLAQQCGAQLESLTGRQTALALHNQGELPEALSWLVDDAEPDFADDSRASIEVYGINDLSGLPDKTRIAQLRQIFARHGIEMEVVES